MTIQELYISIGAGLISVLLGLVTVLIFRHMARVEKALIVLGKQHQTSEVAEARLQGHIESINQTSERTQHSIGVLFASVSKIWDIVIKNHLAEERPSDISQSGG